MKGTKLSDESYLFVGAGEAGVGIADLLVAALKAEGLDEATARRKVFLFDTKGLITAGRGDAATMQHHKKPYAHDFQPAVVSDLLECVKLLKPSALIGVSTNSDCFTEDIIKLMTAMNGRPIIFPLSNPTRKSECTFAAAVQHSDGKARQTIHFARPTSLPFQPHAFLSPAIVDSVFSLSPAIVDSVFVFQVLFASGSPFDDYTHGGVTLRPAQANNAYIFPGTPPFPALFCFLMFSLLSSHVMAHCRPRPGSNLERRENHF